MKARKIPGKNPEKLQAISFLVFLVSGHGHDELALKPSVVSSDQKQLPHSFCRRPNAEDLAEPVQPLGGAVTVGGWMKRRGPFRGVWEKGGGFPRHIRPKAKYQRNQVCSIRKLLHEFNGNLVSEVLHAWHADPQFLEVAECDLMSAS